MNYNIPSIPSALLLTLTLTLIPLSLSPLVDLQISLQV